ncbi:hypothetical protein ACYG9R_01720 [Mesorhizobium sp. RSR565B]|uniref:hypothetical protein n=1 Tax=Mesorhizobium sp. L103C565B0 TaxID=1287094 RepID=UPI0003D01C58|nr:hypothetical protein [Mesorhizobium sp. L103C565B0]ESZ46621.1 hypothetical protein X730_18685 [Mesorhizobium sp. L103C565B0]
MVSHRIAFIVRDRSLGARDLVRVVRDASKTFKNDPNSVDAANASDDAWKAMVGLFDVLRNEQDHGKPIRYQMSEDTGQPFRGVSHLELLAMLGSCRIDRKHPGIKILSLRDALNKIAHHNKEISTYRLDGRGAHYLVLAGQEGNKQWVAEFLVSRFCRNATAAIRAL